MQCPRCGGHRREEIVVDGKKGKRWLIDRCARETCRYNFDIEPWEKKDDEPSFDSYLKKPFGGSWGPDGKWYS